MANISFARPNTIYSPPAPISSPLIPRQTISEYKPILVKLRAFGTNNISRLTASEADPRLLGLVEIVKTRGQGVLQRMYVSFGMQRLPWLHTNLTLARLEHEQQRVESGDDFGDWVVQ